MEIEKNGYDDEINMIDYLRVIGKRKMLICYVIIVMVGLTVVASFVMTPMYEAKAVIAPAAKAGESSGASMLAAQLGISAPTSSNMSEIVNLLKSNILREKLIKRYDLLPVLLRGKNLANKSDSQKMWMGIRYLQDRLKINSNQKDNSIQITMFYRDPKISADVVTWTLVELTDHMSNEARRVAETNKKYLEAQIDKTADPFIKAKIYALIAQQIETSMMAEVKENFAFKVLDPAKVPDRPASPKRIQMAIIAFIISLFVGLFVAFGKEYWENNRCNVKR